MDLIFAFAAFVAAMAICLSTSVTMLVPLCVGLAAFITVGLRRKFALRDLLRMSLRGAGASLLVVVVMLLIGCLTSLWRQCGTIAYFTYYGIRLIPPRIFILAAFLLTSGMAYALGTSFGTAGAIGVILMTIARANGISTAMTGGAILSGLYFGDRGSPASSAANLTAYLTRTDMSRNFRRMLRSAVLPMAICAALYLALSLTTEVNEVDLTLLDGFGAEFNLSPWCLVPTLLLLGLAFAGMKVRHVMCIDIAVSFALTMLLQKVPFTEVFRAMLVGFTPKNPALTATLAGGGVKSMLEVMGILLLSGGCSGIFGGTRMLDSIERVFERLSSRWGRFPAMVAAAVSVCAVFCNQTVGAMMCAQLMGGRYGEAPEEREAMMLDMENSVITIAGLVPWCIACSVPVRLLDCGMAAVPFAAYLYLTPICWYIHLKRKGDVRR